MVINVGLRNSKIKISGLEKFSPRKYETQHVRRQVDSLNSILDPQYLKLKRIEDQELRLEYQVSRIKNQGSRHSKNFYIC